MSLADSLHPFRARLDRHSVQIQPNTGGYVKRIGGLAGIYCDEKSFQQLAQRRSNEIAYRVDELRFSNEKNDLISGISVLKSGNSWLLETGV